MVDALAAGVATAEDARLVGPQRARHGVDGELVEVAPRQVLGARARDADAGAAGAACRRHVALAARAVAALAARAQRAGREGALRRAAR